MKKFESVGFTHEQAEVLTDVIEKSHVDAQQDLKEFINKKFDDFNKKFDDIGKELVDLRTDMGKELTSLRTDMSKELTGLRTDMGKELTNLELRIKASHSDLLMKIFAIIVGCTSLAVAISKLL